jgi:hypothetical protein
MEVIARLFLGRKDGIEMGDQGNASGRPPTARQHQVGPPLPIRRGHILRREPQRREAFGGESAKPVYSVGVCGETVNAHHLPQHFQRGGHLIVKKSRQRPYILHRIRVEINASKVNATSELQKCLKCLLTWAGGLLFSALF